MPKPMIPGGPTERVKNGGGQDLFISLVTTMAGNSIDVCAFAVARCTCNVAFCLSEREEAKAFIRQIAEDAINELELNWPNRDQLVADAIASWSPQPGNG